MIHDLGPGVFGPIERFNAHQHWETDSRRIWSPLTNMLGHALIEAYDLPEPDMLPQHAEYSPEEFVLGLLFDDANDGGIVETLSEVGLPRYDYEEDWNKYYDDIATNILSQGAIPAKGKDAIHDIWQKRCDLAYDTQGAQDFRVRAINWGEAFREGTYKLIDGGELPISRKTFDMRLSHPHEVGYTPQYVQRLIFLGRGETGKNVPNGAFSDHSYGVIFNTDYPDNPDVERSRYIHELVHFYLDGLLSRETVMTTGDHVAVDAHIGMWEMPISMYPEENEAGAVFEGMVSRHMELNEGGTEYLAARIHEVLPELGHFSSRGTYVGWRSLWDKMKADGVDMVPLLGYKITDQGYTEDTLMNRLRWYGAMVEEIDHIYVAKSHHGDVRFGWPQLDVAVKAVTAVMDPYSEDTEQFTSLLDKPSKLIRWAEVIGRGRGFNEFFHRQRQNSIRPQI